MQSCSLKGKPWESESISSDIRAAAANQEAFDF